MEILRDQAAIALLTAGNIIIEAATLKYNNMGINLKIALGDFVDKQKDLCNAELHTIIRKEETPSTLNHYFLGEKFLSSC